MSTLRIDNLSTGNGTFSIPTDVLTRAACRAWVNFNGVGTVAIRAAYNVSSITDNGVGRYVVNFTNPMIDSNYCVTTGCKQDANLVSQSSLLHAAVYATTSISVNGEEAAVGARDLTNCNVSVFR